MTLSMLAENLCVELIGSDAEFTHLSTDTRTLKRGELYLALTGEHFDGNDFVEEAEAKGACAAIVSRAVETQLPYIQVPDCHQALGSIAALTRKRSDATVIALTGSQGKTTVKEMIGAILNRQAETLITRDNLNNTIGVPLTLLRLHKAHSYAVIEMGADRAGEIDFSARITQPDIVLITNASAAHIEGFGSLQGIVQAKGEIIDSLPANGIAIFNADDENVDAWIERAGKRKVVLASYGNQSGSASYYATDVSVNDRGQVSFNMITPHGEFRISLRLLGKHNVSNALIAAAAAMEAGASLTDIQSGLAELAPVQGRLYPRQGINGSHIIDDTYNASPSSFIAAIDVLMAFPAKKIVLAGDMRELGGESEAAHSSVGKYAAAAGVDELWTVGALSKYTAKAFDGKGKSFTTQTELIDACKELANDGIVFLVKGSRGSKMESVVNELSVGGGS